MRAIFVAVVAVAVPSCSGRNGGLHEPARKAKNPPGIDPSAYRSACAAIASCIPAAKWSVSDCATRRTQLRLVSSVDMVYRGADLSDAEVRCIATADGDCTVAARCLGASPQAESCRPSAADSCEGRVARGCHRGMGIRTTESCEDSTSCHPCTARGTCCGKACPVQPRCDGDFVQRCENGFLAGEVDCRAYGMSCADHPTAVSDCLGNGPACAGLNLQSRCDGQDLVTCFSRQELRISCSELDGMVCASWHGAAGNGGRCLLPQRQCTAGNERCVGSTMRFCDDGVVADVDCKVLGFTACGQRADGHVVCLH